MNPAIVPEPGRQRQPLVDLAKGMAALIIMLHHFSLYGPVAQALKVQWPAASHLLAQYGRYGVQVFLVLGGYLAAQALMRLGAQGARGWLGLVLRRWWRLAGPFMAAVLLTLLAHAMTASAVPELLPDHVSLPQLAAHALLLHDVLGFEALTVGAWYVAIDWQLYALLSLLMVAGPARPGSAWRWILIFGLALASLFFFNRDDRWDTLAIYFFGSYGLGVACAWIAQWDSRRGIWRVAAAALLLAIVCALWLEFRGRLLCAAVTAAALLTLQFRTGPSRWLDRPFVRALGECSYALFLVHFAVCLWGNAWFVSQGAGGPGVPSADLVLLLMALGSLAMAVVFHRWVEQPLAGLRLSNPTARRHRPHP